MADAIIRPALNKDLNDLAKLWLDFMSYLVTINPDYYSNPNMMAFRKSLGQYLLDDQSNILVAEHQQQIIGFLMAKIDPHDWFGAPLGLIRYLVVHGDFQKEGIGKQLVEGIMHWFKAHKINRVELYVLKDLPAASFWEKQGFQVLMDRRFLEL